MKASNVVQVITSTNATLTINTNALLGRFHFDTNTWPGEQGQSPITDIANLVLTNFAVTNNAVLIDNSIATRLVYRDVETNGAANISFQQGTIRFYFAPNWDSGTGPGSEGRFVELGTRDSTDGWWALTVNSNGTAINFITQTNGAGITNLSATINWQSGWYHQVVLTYSETNSSLYIDGAPSVTNGSGVTYWPTQTARAQGIKIGSGADGTHQIRGMLDEMETFNYPLATSDIATGYAQSSVGTIDSDGLPRYINQFYGISPSTGNSSNGLSYSFEYTNHWNLSAPTSRDTNNIQKLQLFTPLK